MTYAMHLLVPIAILWPMLNGFLLIFRSSRSWAIKRAPWAALPALILALLAPPKISVLTEPLLGAHWQLDPIGRIFLLFSAIIWLATGLSCGRRDHNRDSAFLFYLLLAMAGNFYLIVAQDIFSFYIGYAVMSFSSYGLIVATRSLTAMFAGKLYIVMMVLGELLLFAGLVLAVQGSDSLAFDTLHYVEEYKEDPSLALLLIFSAFAIKIGFFGVHVWMPFCYSVTPTIAAAALAGAMAKAGILGWLRFLPIGCCELPQVGEVLCFMGIATCYYGAVVGVLQKKPKVVLAYSSISQMGLATAMMGMSLLLPDPASATISMLTLFATHHALNKSALFLGLDYHQRYPNWFSWLLIAVPALALTGLPLTSGLLVKHSLKEQAHELPVALAEWMPLALSGVSFTTTVLVCHFMYALKPRPGQWHFTLQSRQLVVWVAVIVCGQWLPWQMTLTAHSSLTEIFAWVTFNSIWPILLGALIALSIVYFRKYHRFRCAIPVGDLYVPLAWLITRVVLQLKRTDLQSFLRARSQAINSWIQCHLERIKHWAAWEDARITEWPFAISISMGLIIVISAFNLLLL